MLNKDLHSPSVRVFAFDEELGRKTLVAIDVFAPGDLKVEDIEGNAVTVTFPAVASGGGYPVRWWLQIRKVFNTGTTIPLASLVGLH